MILILGGSGYVSRRFQDLFKCHGVTHDAISIRNFESTDKLKTIIKGKMPDLVINCTGYTGSPNIEACEDNKRECLFVNAVLAGVLADICNELGVPLAHVSTGCIYTGNACSRWQAFRESDVPNFSFTSGNASWYSGTKAMGEELMRKSWDKTYIWRIRMPFNHIPHEKNLINKYIKYSKLLRVANSYTNLDEFVINAYKSVVAGAPYGTYNMVNPGSLDAKDIMDIGKKWGVVTQSHEYLSESEFNKISFAPRSSCVLDSEKISHYAQFLPISQSFALAFKFWGQERSMPFW